MTNQSFLLIYKVETPLHMGNGTELGVVDMPIQREKVTGFPKLEASGIKGSARRVFDNENRNLTNAIFGPEDDGSQYSSCISFSDAKILLFPVKSAQGIFKWVTCPFILERFIRDYNLRLSKNIEYKIPQENQYYTQKGNIKGEFVILEDFKFELSRIKECVVLDLIIKIIEKDSGLPENLKEKIMNEIIVISDDSFRFFTEMSTEINTRIKIGDKGIAETGKLFTEEYLPMETILYGFISVEKFMMQEENQEKDNKVKEYLKEIEKEIDDEPTEFNYVKSILSRNNYIQFGGNKTLGKGITQLIIGGE